MNTTSLPAAAAGSVATAHLVVGDGRAVVVIGGKSSSFHLSRRLVVIAESLIGYGAIRLIDLWSVDRESARELARVALAGCSKADVQDMVVSFVAVSS